MSISGSEDSQKKGMTFVIRRRGFIEASQPLLAECAQTLGQWLRQGITAYVFCHCPYEEYSPTLCVKLYQQVDAIRPLPAWYWLAALLDTEPEQARLF